MHTVYLMLPIDVFIYVTVLVYVSFLLCIFT